MHGVDLCLHHAMMGTPVCLVHWPMIKSCARGSWQCHSEIAAGTEVPHACGERGNFPIPQWPTRWRSVLPLGAFRITFECLQLTVSQRLQLTVSQRLQLTVSQRLQLTVSQRLQLTVSHRLQLTVSQLLQLTGQ